MKKIYLFLPLIILALVVANICYYMHIYDQQVTFQKKILLKQTMLCRNEIETHISDLTNEINFFLYPEDIADFFNDAGARINGTRKMEAFLNKYNQLISGISLFDNNNNVYSLSRDRGNNMISDIFVSREQNDLSTAERTDKHNGELVWTLPVLNDNQAIANIVVQINTSRYVEKVFSGYHIGETFWQGLVNLDGKVVAGKSGPGITGTDELENIIPGIPGNQDGGTFYHKLNTSEGSVKVFSTWYPLKLINEDLMIVFSIDSSEVSSDVTASIITISTITFIVLILIIAFFLFSLRKERNEKRKSVASELSMKNIFESLPIGIIIKTTEGKIKSINATALEILKIDNANKVIDKDISNMFFLFRSYTENHSQYEKESTNEYVYYDAGEEEVILYKKEIPFKLPGEDVVAETFIDISHLEKARKNEFLWGEAKTEFLKRVSHDIRNPLNGILNITESLDVDIAPGKPEKEKIELIRHCCEDILLVVNDIVDFSGFETGKIIVEEIPFIFSDEMKLALGPLIKKAQNKKIGMEILIDENIPENLIGDPFHIRQVIDQLISNSLKYTKEGKIRLDVKSKKQDEGIILLEFIIEDSGKGIARELLKKLNDKEPVKELFTAENFGLNKTRQIVNLMKGEITIESPVKENHEQFGPGTRVRFHIQVYSNEISKKTLNADNINKSEDIKALILAEKDRTRPGIKMVLGKLGISCDVTSFNDSTIELLKSRATDHIHGYSIIFIIDSAVSNGFVIARELKANKLDKDYLIILISSVNKPGNFIKSRRHGVDHYLIEPYDKSEILKIIDLRFGKGIMDSKDNTTFEYPGHEIKILVAEDNPSNQIVAQSLFKRLGYEIDIASNGKEAIERVKNAEYDIVFMDIRMPEKNGLDATYEIRRLGYNMPVIAMTANAGDEDKTEAIEVGMNDFVVKPVRIDILKNILIKTVSG